MGQFDKKEMNVYWDAIWRSRNLDDIGRVCHPNAPVWYNQFFDYFQRFNFLRLLKYCGNIRGKRVLDIGCGNGRWCRILNAKGAIATGIDIQPEAIKLSKRLTPSCKFRVMPADKLGFKDKSFDIITSVTVLQHMPHKSQGKAINEAVRATKKGGYILIIENTRDIAPHVFSKPYRKWIKEFEKRDCKLVARYGEGYTPLIRLLNKSVKFLSASDGNADARKYIGRVLRKKGFIRQLFFAIQYPLILLSYPLEYLCDFILPDGLATHGAFLFRRL